MQPARFSSCFLLTSIAALLVACGDDASTTGTGSTTSSSAGGAGQGGAGDGGASSSSGGAGTGTGGAGPSCAATTEISALIFTQGPNSWLGTLNPGIGAGAADLLTMFIPPGGTGTIALASAADRDDCGVTVACVDAGEDVNGAMAARRFRHAGGTLELGTTSPPYYVSGAMLDVTLVEATLGADGVWTDVPGGSCLHVANLSFDLQPPVAGWTCAPFVYDEVGQGALNAFCDCACGAVDPDCADSGLAVRGCAMGQGCSAGLCQ
jgi:hypothetical protein